MLDFGNYLNVCSQDPKGHDKRQPVYDFIASVLRAIKEARITFLGGMGVKGAVEIGEGLSLDFKVDSNQYMLTVKDLFCLNVLYAKRLHREPFRILTEEETEACRKAIEKLNQDVFTRLNALGITGKVHNSKGDLVWQSKAVYPLLNPAFFLRLASPETDFFYKLFFVRNSVFWPKRNALEEWQKSSHSAQLKVLYRGKIKKIVEVAEPKKKRGRPKKNAIQTESAFSFSAIDPNLEEKLGWKKRRIN